MKRKSLPTGRDFLFVEGYGNENPGAFQSPRPLRGATSGKVVYHPQVRISTHAPLAGRDHEQKVARKYSTKFQPTRPLRGATNVSPNQSIIAVFQPTRPLRGATAGLMHRLSAFDISTHAPLAGRDMQHTDLINKDKDFNPRAPCGARRKEIAKGSLSSCHFNPRAPCGARPPSVTGVHKNLIFQPTRPLRGATAM